jgi:K+-transporting ATPase KdpF subunit
MSLEYVVGIVLSLLLLGYVVGIVLSLLLLGYLLYALLRPERF